MEILRLPEVKCKLFPGGPDSGRSVRFLHCKNLYHLAIAFFCSGGLLLLGSGLSTGNMLSIFGSRANHTSPSPLEGFGIFRAQKTDSELRQIARREWWLWLSAVFVTAFSGVAFLLSTFPRLFLHSEHFYEIRSDQARWGVLCLLLLFNGRLVYRQWEFRRRRMELTGQGAGAQANAEQINDPTVVDPVTGLYTRHFIEQQLGKEIARSRRQNSALSLATIHLDDFAEMSKQYGAAAMDEAVKELARRLKRACRGSDFAVRLGKDDFLLVLPECNLGEAKVVLNRVGPLETTCSGHKVTLGYTTGWVDYQQGDLPSDLLRRATDLLRLYDTAAKESFASTPLPH
jgi:diguanylate cyclase (GGDEF)-like protein